MTQRSYFWDGTTGDGGTYSSTELMDYVFRAIFGTPGSGVDPATMNRGVLYGWLNQLRVIDGGANTAIVDTGGAINCGLFYENTSPLSVNIPNGPRTDLLVLRRSWAGQTIRVTRVAAMTRNFGVTYDIPLAQIVVGGGGGLTITDMREFCQFSFMPGEASIWNSDLEIGTGLITAAKLDNQTRSHFHGVGMARIEDDVSTPIFNSEDYSAVPGESTVNIPQWDPNNIGWRCETTDTSALWITDRLDDLAGASASVYVWNTPAVDEGGRRIPPQSTGSVVWGYQAWVGSNGAARATPSGFTVVDNANRLELGPLDTRQALRMYRDLVATISCTANDLIHLRVFRNGGHASDTCNLPTRWMGIELEYEADS